jgi:transcriptional regulator with XRE-family HTH domain
MSVFRKPHKEEVYKQAISLRKRGFSYREIADICNISIGTASKWLTSLPEAGRIVAENKRKAAKENSARLLLINKARNTERSKQYKEAERMARIEYQNYSKNPLFMAGLALYVALGDKEHSRLLRLSSSKPELHRLFIRFVMQFLGAEKSSVHFWLLLYPEHDEIVCMQHWSKKVGISPSQFYKNHFVESLSTKQTLHFGVGNTIIGSTLLKKKLSLWIRLALKDWK